MGSGRLGQFSAALSALVVRNFAGIVFTLGPLVIRLDLVIRPGTARLLIFPAILGRFSRLSAFTGLLRAIHLDLFGPPGLTLSFLGKIEPIIPGFARFVRKFALFSGFQFQGSAGYRSGIPHLSGFGPIHFNIDVSFNRPPDFG